MSTLNSFDKRGDILNLRNDGTVISMGYDDKILIGKSGYSFLTGIVIEVIDNPETMLNESLDENDPKSLLVKNKIQEEISFPNRTQLLS